MDSLKQLLAQQEKLANDIKALRAREAGTAIAQVQDIMAVYSLTAEMLFPNHKILTTEEYEELIRVEPKVTQYVAAPVVVEQTQKTERAKVAPKYRDPKNPENVWSGRGIKPKWMTKAIEDGAKIEDFMIDKQVATSTPVAEKPTMAEKISKMEEKKEVATAGK